MKLLEILEQVSQSYTSENNLIFNPPTVFVDQIKEEIGEKLDEFLQFDVDVVLNEPLTFLGTNGTKVVFRTATEGEEVIDVTNEFYGLLLDELEACE